MPETNGYVVSTSITFAPGTTEEQRRTALRYIKREVESAVEYAHFRYRVDLESQTDVQSVIADGDEVRLDSMEV